MKCLEVGSLICGGRSCLGCPFFGRTIGYLRTRQTPKQIKYTVLQWVCSNGGVVDSPLANGLSRNGRTITEFFDAIGYIDTDWI